MPKNFFIGADVSKDKIDFYFLTPNDKKPKFISLPNQLDLIQTYFKPIAKENLTVVFEPTSNYHLALQTILK